MSRELLAAQTTMFGLIVGYLDAAGIVSRTAFATALRDLAQEAGDTHASYLRGFADGIVSFPPTLRVVDGGRPPENPR